MKDGKDLRPARGETGRDRYDPLSQALHWATAVLVLASFALALWPELVKGSAAPQDVLHAVEEELAGTRS